MPTLQHQKIEGKGVKWTIVVPQELKDAVLEAAYRTRKSASLWVREALEKALKELEQGASS